MLQEHHECHVTERRREATEDELKNLPRVVDEVPSVVWIALLAGAAERFTFYAISAPWQNYIQNDDKSIAIPGALGLGQATATNISSAFSMFSYLTPLPFAILSDVWIGRYKTVCIGFALNLCGCIVLFITSLPLVTHNSIKILGLSLSMILLGLGTGAVKATISPFIADQYPVLTPQLVTTKAGKRVVADRNLTIQYIYNVFYWFTNIASLSLIASTYLEKKVSFWAAYLLPLSLFWMSLPLLLIRHRKFVKIPPQGNVLPRAAKVIVCAVRERFRLDSARPAFQAEHHGRLVEWDDSFVSEMKKGLIACKVMACFVPFYLCMNQIANNLVSQAGQMQLDGIPNDTVQALNPIACVLLGPIIQKALYPTFRQYSIAFGPIIRMVTGFAVMSAAMAVAAGLQKAIYTKGPCYDRPLLCAALGGGSTPNSISIWAQTPVYFLIAFAEILGFTTLAEYSYSKAPKDMRSLVQALRQAIAGIGSAVGMAVSPLAVDPEVMYLYTGLATVMAISALGFWLAFRGYDSHDNQ